MCYDKNLTSLTGHVGLNTMKPPVSRLPVAFLVSHECVCLLDEWHNCSCQLLEYDDH